MSKIWFDKSISIEGLQVLSKNTMSDYIGIEFTRIGDDYLEATMPVDHRTRQPYGLLHGGASVVLAETLGSVAAAMVVDRDVFLCVGLEINANHIRSATNGKVTGTATPIHLGSSTQIWEIRIRNEDGELTCISRLTVAVLKKKSKTEKIPEQG